jgi:MFS family permease
MQSLIAPAIPHFERVFATDASGGGWILTAFLLSASVVTPVMGRVGDLFGKRRTLIAVLLVFACGSVVSALATSLPTMVAGRLIQGVGAGAVPLAFGIIGDTFPARHAAGGIGFVSSLIGVGAGAGVVLAGPILSVSSIHWLFWGPAAIAVLTAAAVRLFVVDSPVRAAGGVNWTGALLLGSGLATVLLAITQFASWGPASPGVWLSAAVGALLLGLWVRSESRSEHPLVDMTTMRIRGVWTANVCAFLVGLGTYVSFIEIPKLVQAPVASGYGFGASVTESGLYLLPWTCMILVAGQFTGVLDRRYGSKPPLVLGTSLTLLAFGLLVAAHGEPLELLVSSAVMGAGIGLALGAMANQTIASVRADQSGVASAVNLVMRLVGGAVGAQAAAAILDRSRVGELATEHGYMLTFAFSGVALAAAVLAALASPSRRPRQPGLDSPPQSELL